MKVNINGKALDMFETRKTPSGREYQVCYTEIIDRERFEKTVIPAVAKVLAETECKETA